MRYFSAISPRASFQITTLCHSVRSTRSPLWSFQLSLVAMLRVTTLLPPWVVRTSGSRPMLPISCTRLTVTVNCNPLAENLASMESTASANGKTAGVASRLSAADDDAPVGLWATPVGRTDAASDPGRGCPQIHRRSHRQAPAGSVDTTTSGYLSECAVGHDAWCERHDGAGPIIVSKPVKPRNKPLAVHAACP